VYQNMAGSLAGTATSSIALSNGVGLASLIITVVVAAIALWLLARTRSEKGRYDTMRLFEHIPLTAKAMYQLALSRFTAALATHVSSGITNEEAMEKAIGTVEHDKLRSKLKAAYASMIDLDDPRSLAQAVSEHNVFEPLYARMLNVGMRSGSSDETLAQMSSTFFDDAVLQIDRALDRIEPILAAFLTIAVGATLVAVMIPLIGIMGSIG